MHLSGAIPPSLTAARSPEAASGSHGPLGLVAAKVRPSPAHAIDRVELSGAAREHVRSAHVSTMGSLSPFRSAADRVEAATGVARGRLVDRLA